jgi:hypothetical protein
MRRPLILVGRRPPIAGQEATPELVAPIIT